MLSAPTEERAAFVRDRFGSDAAIRDELLEMLRHLNTDSAFLEPPPERDVRALLAWTEEEPDPSAPDLLALEGTLVAGRYLLGGRLGTGGAGVVYQARDAFTDADVAVKVLRDKDGDGRHDQRWEAATLRLLRVPGVVQLLDEGVSEGLTYLVTGLVDGSPFPGRDLPLVWADIADTVLAFLETLDRIHWAGIVHRDLKPGNVLVDGKGRPHVLDLGIAARRSATGDGKAKRARRGTLRYMAPEQLRGEPATVRSDLYSAGVMIHEALAGEPYRSDPSVRLARFGLVSERPKTLDDDSSALPTEARRALDHLLAAAPEDRPSSASEVIAALQTTTTRRPLDRQPPLLGRSVLVDTLRRAVEERTSVDVWGPRGSGKTRLLGEIERDLAATGTDVAWFRGLRDDLPPTGARLREVLGAGGVILVDDADALSEDARARLHGLRGRGPVLRAFTLERPDALHLAPLDESDLRGVFLGHDRLHHVPEDAAHEVWVRTQGLPGAVVHELDAWSRAGLGWWEGPRYRIRRRDLELLARGHRSPVHRSAGVARNETLSEAEWELLLACELAGPRATIPLLSMVLEEAPGLLERSAEALEGRGLLRKSSDGALAVPALPAGFGERLASVGPRLHRRIALALSPGDDRRLVHWVAAGHLDAVPAESIAVARALLEAGDLGGTRSAVGEGLRALASRPDPAWEIELLELNLQTALQVGTKSALDEALNRLGTASPGPRVERLERVARSGLYALDNQPDRALVELPDLGEASSEAERRCTTSVRLFAARMLQPDAHQALIRETRREGRSLGSPALLASAAGALAWLRYRQGRFEDAAEAHLEAASSTAPVRLRVRAILSAGSALLEAGAHDRAERLAQEALAFGVESRHAAVEARAEWLGRAARYRRGDALEPDLDLVRAGGELGAPSLTYLLALTEAAISWRAGHRGVTRRLAGQAVRHRPGEAGRWPRLLAASLERAMGGASDPRSTRELLEECRVCPLPRLALQSAALLLQAEPGIATEAGLLASTRLHEIPAHERGNRLEILSIRESEEILVPATRI